MCRVAGVYGYRFAASMVRTLLFAQQHGGQESCGICVSDFPIKKGLGLVTEIFPDSQVSQLLPGKYAIGHDRYATQGSVTLDNAAPFECTTSFGTVFQAHNGHVINYWELRKFLARKGIGFNGTNDGELILKLIVWKAEQNGHNLVEAIRYAIKKVRGAFSIVLMAPDGMYAFRDRYGYRPLVIGKKRKAYFIVSETCALDKCGARYLREVKPGEIIRISKPGLESFVGFQPNRCASCIFEPIYFAFPSSIVFGMPVWEFQGRMGMRMAELFRPKFEELLKQYHRDQIVISPIPDTAMSATRAFCRELGAEDLYDEVIIRSHYAGRTFINAEQLVRDLKVKLKFSFIKKKIRGKVVIILDDSIVRGSTLRKIVGILKKLGALAVYVVIYSPQITGSCFMGIDTPTRKELVANAKGEPDKVARFLKADYLLHCRVADLRSVVCSFGKDPNDFCYACFNRRYALRVPKEVRKE